MNTPTYIIIGVSSCIVLVGIISLMMYHMSLSCMRSFLTRKRDSVENYSTTNIFKLKKYTFLTFIMCINAGAIYVVYRFSGFRGSAIVLIVLKSKDIICALVLTLYYIVLGFRRLFNKKVEDDVVSSGNIISIVPTYNEPIDDIKLTVDSIIENNVRDMKNLVCVISDGKKSTQDLVGILDSVIHSTNDWPLTSWTGFNLNVTIVFGLRNNTPTMLIVKDVNLGKRDTIILAFDVFNHIRNNAQDTTKNLRTYIRSFIKDTYSMDNIDYMFFTDADTKIETGSFVQLIDTLVSRKAIACCGLVMVDFNGSPYSFWNIYQNFQYMYGQFLRRSVENLLGKVTCLPGCITMFKVDEIAGPVIEKYGTYANGDNMVESMTQNIGTDRRLTSLFLYSSKKSCTTCQLKAIALTKPPTSLVKFIRQRRRWAGNTYFNTMLNVVGPNMSNIIRVFSVLDIMKMSFVYFRLLNIALFLYQLVTNIKVKSFIAQVVVVSWPVVYFFVFSLFVPLLIKQYHKLIAGYLFNKICAGLMSNAISTLMFFNIGNYSWTKNTNMDKVVVT